jgi:hypothetical protein
MHEYLVEQITESQHLRNNAEHITHTFDAMKRLGDFPASEQDQIREDHHFWVTFIMHFVWQAMNITYLMYMCWMFTF